MELILIPLIAALLAAFLNNRLAKLFAFSVSVIQLGITLYFLSQFNNDGTLSHVVTKTWMDGLGFSFNIGMDGISMLMVLLTNLLVPCILLLTWDNESDKKGYHALILLMQAALIGVFCATDGLLFYIFWELALIPIYFICAIWGGENRLKITLKFFIYTFVGSLAMLASLIYLYLKTPYPHSFDISQLVDVILVGDQAIWVALGFLFAFAVKIPVFPFHTWQPDTYTVAPTGGTMMLSGIMLKMGLFGLIRWFLPLFPETLAIIQWPFIILCVIGIIYGAVIAIRQDDLKRLIAYSSISHVALIAAGIMTATLTGIQGSLFQMFSHGINIVALFGCVWIIEKHTGTRSISALGGLAKKSPVFAVLMILAVFGTLAVPLTNGFVGEFLLLNSLFTFNATLSVFAGLTIILCAVYILRMYQLGMFGEAKSDTTVKPLTTQYIALFVLAGIIIATGIFPQPLFDLTSSSVHHIIEQATTLVNIK